MKQKNKVIELRHLLFFVVLLLGAGVGWICLLVIVSGMNWG